jgi:hypothetical protein
VEAKIADLEVKLQEKPKQIQNQVIGGCCHLPSLLVSAVYVAALARECPHARARQLSEINFGSADVGVGYVSTSAGQKQKRADSAEMPQQITEQLARQRQAFGDTGAHVL